MSSFTIEAKPYGKYDVIVCGGGTAGCFAAIAAARAASYDYGSAAIASQRVCHSASLCERRA